MTHTCHERFVFVTLINQIALPVELVHLRKLPPEGNWYYSISSTTTRLMSKFLFPEHHLLHPPLAIPYMRPFLWGSNGVACLVFYPSRVWLGARGLVLVLRFLFPFEASDLTCVAIASASDASRRTFSWSLISFNNWSDFSFSLPPYRFFAKG